ncbi:Alpha/beta hydrolase family protein [Planctomycetes bacterium CA13]|uniref:Alpha/beta hydrolase family protein n=1 Tax=Novipirellula herctigrandis TaxID=2527986 RepID=A0A5C5YWU8_9BACT|nr:Alpha/beta hydrolase family protein [Planctomycetes bacterium CA13]
MTRLRRRCETLFAVLLVTATGCCCGSIPRMTPAMVVAPIQAYSLEDWCTAALPNVEAKIANLEEDRCQMEIQPTAGNVTRLAEASYAIGEQLHALNDDRAVDYWARTIAFEDFAATLRKRDHDDVENVLRSIQVHRSATIRILSTAEKYGRLDPTAVLYVNGLMESTVVPVHHNGFVWDASQFQDIEVFEPPQEWTGLAPSGTEAAGNVDGYGIPVVVLTDKVENIEDGRPTRTDSFVLPRSEFAATALVYFPITLFSDVATESLGPASVVFVNPLMVAPKPRDDGSIANAGIPMAQSPAMALAYSRQESKYSPISAFLYGDNGIDEAGLWFLEPYQQDKIPLIFVHGLLSDPNTFVAMANAVRADHRLRTRYQIWAYRYPTGEEFLRSAATLREDLAIAFAQSTAVNSTNECHAPSNAVIVGHSMGGLVAKLQVIDSDDSLWRSVSNVPIEQINAPKETIDELRRAFYFQSNPHIGRIVYVATPHQGSPWASACVGRLGAKLARRQQPQLKEFEQLVANNPDAFSEKIAESLPTSLDFLRPTSRLIQSLSMIAPAPHAKTNSLIGNRCYLPFLEPSDSVVPVTSALREQDETTTLINATHTGIQTSRVAHGELVRILKLHLDELPQKGYTREHEQDISCQTATAEPIKPIDGA